LQKGTFVLLDSTKEAFSKINDWQRSPQVFKISQVRAFIKPPLYLLSTLKDKPVDGYFYAAQLHKTTKPTSETTYHIEKELEKRVRNGKTETKVKWIGYDNSHNSWVSEEDMVAGHV
jgi:hypothetical protein